MFPMCGRSVRTGPNRNSPGSEKEFSMTADPDGTAVFLCSFSAPGKADVIGKNKKQITIMTYQDILQGTTIEQGSAFSDNFA